MMAAQAAEKRPSAAYVVEDTYMRPLQGDRVPRKRDFADLLISP